MILNEGGNVFKDQDGKPTTQRIQQADVDPTLKWIESITGMDHVNMKLGSTGIKSSSGDLDVAVDKSYDEPTVDNALLSKSDKGLDFGDFRVDIKKEQWGKRNKNWYSIVESDGTVIAKDLALFESVMGIANALLQERDSDVAWFKNADAQYVSKLSECQHYKIMTAKATEDFKIDLYETKFQVNKDRAIQQRQQIRERVWK